jgi:hypothetical protein
MALGRSSPYLRQCRVAAAKTKLVQKILRLLKPNRHF